MANSNIPNVERKMVIAFLVNSMRGGGTERVLSILLKNLSRNNKEFFLIVLEDEFSYDIPEDVRIIKLFSDLKGNFRKLLAVFCGAIKLKRIVKENNIDLVVSFLGRSNYTNILARMFGSKHKAYLSERVNPSKMHSGKSFKNIINSWLTKKMYKRADLIFTNSLGSKRSLIKDFSIKAEDIKVIYNPIDLEKIQILSQKPLEAEYQKLFEHPIIINVARLTEQKGQEYLIRAFSQVMKQIPNIKLLVLGQGELEEYLKQLVKSLKLEKDILFLGWQKNPFKFLAKSKLFVLSSLWEGLPNTLIEAMACYLPVISFDCDSGPREIINNDNGILIHLKDEIALKDSIIKVLKNDSLRQELSLKARKRAEDFSIENIINQYEELIQ